MAIADQAEVGYCTPRFKEVLERVLHSCGLSEGDSRRGCKPADVKTLRFHQRRGLQRALHSSEGSGRRDHVRRGMDTARRQRRRRCSRTSGSLAGARATSSWSRARRSRGRRPRTAPLRLHRRANSVMFHLQSVAQTTPKSRRRWACCGSATSSRSSPRIIVLGPPRAATPSATRKPSTGARSCHGSIVDCEQERRTAARCCSPGVRQGFGERRRSRRPALSEPGRRGDHGSCHDGCRHQQSPRPLRAEGAQSPACPLRRRARTGREGPAQEADLAQRGRRPGRASSEI